MAKDKKSFLLYCDLIHTIEKLPNDKAGELFKIILQYVNDKNPIIEDLLLQISFEPIKQALKRDLVKYTEFIEKQSFNGSKGGRPKKPKETQKTQAFLNKPKKADSVIDNDIDIKLTKVSKPLKISFEDSELFDKNKFLENFPNWSKEKLLHYYDAALRYSIEGNKYVSWKLAIQTWAKKDEIKGFKVEPIKTQSDDRYK